MVCYRMFRKQTCAYLGDSTDTVADLLELTDVESRSVRVDQIITADQHDDRETSPIERNSLDD